jgi:hypothetical protein
LLVIPLAGALAGCAQMAAKPSEGTAQTPQLPPTSTAPSASRYRVITIGPNHQPAVFDTYTGKLTVLPLTKNGKWRFYFPLRGDVREVDAKEEWEDTGDWGTPQLFEDDGEKGGDTGSEGIDITP